MKKNLFWTVLMTICFLAAPLAYSQPIVAGDPSAGNSITFSAVTADGFDANLRVIAVFTRDPGIAGTVVQQDKHRGNRNIWVLEYADNPAAFAGAKMYALGTQKDWSGTAVMLIVIDSEKALATADITVEFAKFHFVNRYPDSSYYYQPIIWMIEMKDGKRAWGGHPDYPGGQYIVYNKLGQPQTWLKIDNETGKVLPPGTEGKDLAKKLR